METLNLVPATSLIGADPRKCQQRNHIAALRYGVNSASIYLAANMKESPEFSRGQIPSSIAATLERINALLPSNAPNLTAEDIDAVPLEAGSSRFIRDRFMFLGTSTLRNVARDADAGFAFMNSHRTGALSTPSELPYGRTFAGRYERFPQTSKHVPPLERSVLGVYMLRNSYPNGTQGPSTDTLYRSIMGGTLFDASLGLNGGTPVCDMCGNELRSKDCPHVPGTHHGLSKEQKLTQERRGVTKGFASYTLEDAHAGEVSGVYNGAIPGAGFSKAVEMLKAGELSADDLSAVRYSYASLISEGEFGMDNEETIEGLAEQVTPSVARRVASMFGFLSPRPVPLEPVIETAVISSSSDQGSYSPRADESGSDSRRVAELERQLKERDDRLRSIGEEINTQLAEGLVAEMMGDGKLMPAGEPATFALARLLSEEDRSNPKLIEYQDNVGKAHRVSRVELMRKVFEDVPQHNLLSDHSVTELPEGALLLSNDVSLADEEMLEEAKADARAASGGNKHKRPGRANSQNGHSDHEE